MIAADHTVVRAGRDDAGVLSQVIADAFVPLDVSRWLVPHRAARQNVFPGYFRLFAEHALTAGLVHTTPGRAAAALWIPAGASLPGPPFGYAWRLREVTGLWAGRFLALDAAVANHYPDDFPYHYLAILAVRPDRQARGIGTALLRAHHAVLDSVRMPAYLEARDLRTRQLYLAHGYTDYCRPIELFPDGPALYPMLRRPVRAVALSAGTAASVTAFAAIRPERDHRPASHASRSRAARPSPRAAGGTGRGQVSGAADEHSGQSVPSPVAAGFCEGVRHVAGVGGGVNA